MSVRREKAAQMAAISSKGRMRGAVPVKKRESEKQAKRSSSAKKNVRRSGPEKLQSAELKSCTTTEISEATGASKKAREGKAGKAPKKKSGTLRGAARRVKQAIPDIVDRMLEEAKKGNVQHLKTVLQCTGVDKLLEQECKPRKQKSLAELLIRRLETQNETEESGAGGTESE